MDCGSRAKATGNLRELLKLIPLGGHVAPQSSAARNWRNSHAIRARWIRLVARGGATSGTWLR